MPKYTIYAATVVGVFGEQVELDNEPEDLLDLILEMDHLIDMRGTLLVTIVKEPED